MPDPGQLKICPSSFPTPTVRFSGPVWEEQTRLRPELALGAWLRSLAVTESQSDKHLQFGWKEAEPPRLLRIFFFFWTSSRVTENLESGKKAKFPQRIEATTVEEQKGRTRFRKTSRHFFSLKIFFLKMTIRHWF